MIRVGIAEPHTVVANRLKQLCQDTHDMGVTGVVSRPEEFLGDTHTIRPDVMILSLSRRPDVTFAAVRELKRRYPETPLIILSLYHHDSYAFCALEAGASGYLMMEHAQEQLIETIRMFVLGGPLAPTEHFAAI